MQRNQLQGICSLSLFPYWRWTFSVRYASPTGMCFQNFQTHRYYALKTDRLDHESWRDVTLSKALKVVPKQLAVQPLFLSIDDTMVEKEGEKFELRSKLFDHAAHNGSNYLNGHCMVSILLSFPVLADGSIRYISVPLGYRLWDKKQTKLEIAAEMVRHAVDSIGSDRQVFLLCDSWYPKGCVAGLVDEYENLSACAQC